MLAAATAPPTVHVAGCATGCAAHATAGAAHASAAGIAHAAGCAAHTAGCAAHGAGGTALAASDAAHAAGGTTHAAAGTAHATGGAAHPAPAGTGNALPMSAAPAAQATVAARCDAPAEGHAVAAPAMLAVTADRAAAPFVDELATCCTVIAAGGNDNCNKDGIAAVAVEPSGGPILRRRGVQAASMLSS